MAKRSVSMHERRGAWRRKGRSGQHDMAASVPNLKDRNPSSCLVRPAHGPIVTALISARNRSSRSQSGVGHFLPRRRKVRTSFGGSRE